MSLGYTGAVIFFLTVLAGGCAAAHDYELHRRRRRRENDTGGDGDTGGEGEWTSLIADRCYDDGRADCERGTWGEEYCPEDYMEAYEAGWEDAGCEGRR